MFILSEWDLMDFSMVVVCYGWYKWMYGWIRIWWVIFVLFWIFWCEIFGINILIFLVFFGLWCVVLVGSFVMNVVFIWKFLFYIMIYIVYDNFIGILIWWVRKLWFFIFDIWNIFYVIGGENIYKMFWRIVILIVWFLVI